VCSTGQRQLDLDKLGLRDDDLDTFRQLIHKPNGIVIVTGPTGSGKTTTLYSALRELNDRRRKILTAEDPVEYDIDGSSRCRSTETSADLRRGLRSFLRQDPDIILVGEIRDLETARSPCRRRSPATWCSPRCTPTTRPAPSPVCWTWARAVPGHRDARRHRRPAAGAPICPTARRVQPTEEQLMELELTPEDVAGAASTTAGCDYCNNTGYRGRWDLRDHGARRRPARADHAARLDAGAAQPRPASAACARCAERPAGDLRRMTTIEEVVRETVAIVSAIMIFVIPEFESIFADFNVELPGITIFLLNVSRWFANQYGWVYLLATPVLIYMIIRLAKLSEGGRYAVDLLKLKIPILGAIVGKSVVARFTRTLGTLISAGVPILDAINITKDTCGNEVFSRAMIKVHDAIREGESFADPLRASKVCDAIVVNMVDVGEETGDLDKMLLKVADNYENDVDVLVSSLVSILEPVMVVVLGGLVGFIVIALFMPMISLLEGLS
jgi:energy-coupling factor transporter ATP-binding protein EcfA2